MEGIPYASFASCTYALRFTIMSSCVHAVTIVVPFVEITEPSVQRWNTEYTMSPTPVKSGCLAERKYGVSNVAHGMTHDPTHTAHGMYTQAYHIHVSRTRHALAIGSSHTPVFL